MAEPEPTLTINAPEADARVWLHARATSAQNILAVSPDTDTYHIDLGLPWISKSSFLCKPIN